MSRWIDADALEIDLKGGGNLWKDPFDSVFGYTNGQIKSAPSIDIVFCKECKWIRYCETEDLDLYLDCDKPDGGGIPQSEEWFCADGEREGE